MLQWQSPPKLNIPSDLLDLVQGNAVLAQLLVQRGLATVDQVRGFLDADHYRPAPPDVLPDVDRAVVRLSRAINQREPIWVWGDFDADGQTSTTVLVSALRQLGGFVRYYIPNRMTESHGIKLPALERVLAQRAGLILTCDTGIAEHEAVATAQAAGLPLLVSGLTDGFLTKAAVCQVALAFGFDGPAALNGSQFTDETALFPTKAQMERDGYVYLNDEPGIGVQPDEEALRELAQKTAES